MWKLLSVLPIFHAHVDIQHPPLLHKSIVNFSFMCKSGWCIQATFYLTLTYLTLLVVKKIHVTAQTQYFSLYYVGMDIVTKEKRSSICSYRCYFAIFFSALLILILHPFIAVMTQGLPKLVYIDIHFFSIDSSLLCHNNQGRHLKWDLELVRVCLSLSFIGL